MKDKAKPNIKPAVSIKPAAKQEQKGQNKIVLALSVLMLLVLLISMMVPVYYIPLFNNISARYGLSSDIARKLTLFDLALSSLGIETPNMAATFKKYQMEYEPDVFYTSRFYTDSNDRLINARETYYHEYERTRKRPAEIAGIYRDGKEVNTPEIDGDLKGVRALPKDNLADFGHDDYSVKAPTKTSIRDEILGSKRRQVRGSFDNEGQEEQDKKSKKNPLPDFASSIYNQDGKEGETQTLENSRMVKPLVQNQEFVVIKPENIISEMVGDSSFTDTFAALKNFGGYDGALGYYIKDDLPKFDMLDFFKSSGKQAFMSYLYSYTAVGREYLESSKHLAEIAFHGDEPQDEILIAKGQKKSKVPTMDPADMSPIELVLTVRHNMEECREAGAHYREIIGPLNNAYDSVKTQLINISAGNPQNLAWRGAPGSCVCSVVDSLCNPTVILRNQWNNLLPKLKTKCKAVKEAMRNYADACKMEYLEDPNKDNCDSIDALKVKGGTAWTNIQHGSCRGYVIWESLDDSPTFNGCGGIEHPFGELPPVCVLFGICSGEQSKQHAARQDCVTKINNLFDAIDANIQLEPKPGFVFVD
ncbi:MAG: hypothetical protein J5594_06255 [Elusimicrobiaceae bacterium]|nr:hypothetical protein [Elusimicrobiaceae bacterium]